MALSLNRKFPHPTFLVLLHDDPDNLKNIKAMPLCQMGNRRSTEFEYQVTQESNLIFCLWD